MRALEILLERRWILKSREKELYYQIKDELGTVKKFLMEKLGYQVIVNPYLVKVEKMPATPENWMGIQEFTRKIEYVFFLYDFNVSGRKRSRRAICTFRADRIYTGAVQGGAD